MQETKVKSHADSPHFSASLDDREEYDEENDRDDESIRSRYFRDVRRYKVQRRKQEIAWFTELDALYRKHIACFRVWPSVRALVKDSVHIRDDKSNEDEQAVAYQKISLSPWWRYWWRDRDWRRIDTSVEILRDGAECAQDKSEDFIFTLTQTLAIISPYYERASALRQEIARHNLRLVVSATERYKMFLDDLDLIQEGNLGLFRAIDKFMFKKGWKFGTYAMWWIRQAMSRASLTQGGIVSIPSHIGERLSKIARTEGLFIKEHHRFPSQEEIADSLGWHVEQVRQAASVRSGYISLSQPASLEDDRTPLERLKTQSVDDGSETYSSGKRVLVVREALAEVKLSPRQMKILDLRFVHNFTLQKIAGVLTPPLSRERVRQIMKEMLDRIKKNPKAMALLKDLL